MVDVTVPMDDAELMRSAMTDEKPPAAEPERQERQEAQAEPDTGPVRDEHGRFAPREKAPEQAAQQPDASPQPPGKTEQQPDPDQNAHVPSWRLREMREEREAVAKRAAEAEERAQRYEAQLREFRAEQARQQQKPPPDMLAEPEAWQQHLVSQQQQALDNMRFNFSEDWAVDKYGQEKVEQVKRWIESDVRDPATRQSILTARNPYREMVKLYDERQTLSQIGGDLNAYRAKLQEEFLNDPGFMEKVAAKLRGDQNGNGSAPTNGQRPVVQLPPSLSRTAAARVPQDSAGDLSDASLISYAYAPGRR